MLSFKTDPTALHLHSPFIPRSLPPPSKTKPHQDLQEPPKLTKNPKEKNLCTPALPLPFQHDTRFRNHSFQKVLSAIVRTKVSFLSPTHHTFARKRGICNNGKETNDGSTATAACREGERRTLARAAMEIRGCKARFGTAGKML